MISRTKHIGIVGCSAEGAALCYRTICATGAKMLGGHAHPPVSIHTPSFEEYMECLRRDDWNGVSLLMIESANKLADIGAEFLICPDNTIHQALPYVAAKTTLPWLHIAEVVADEAVQRGFRRLGILGTKWLVDGEVYPEQLRARNLDYLRPTISERDEIDRIIFEELVRGVLKQESVDYVRTVIERMGAMCDSVVLGCTELPLIINDTNSALPTLDSTRLLAWAALERATGIEFSRIGRPSSPTRALQRDS
jgi:aspartate racemase